MNLDAEQWAKLSIYRLIRRGDEIDRTLDDVLWVLRRLHWDRTGETLKIDANLRHEVRLRLEPEQGSGLADAADWAALIIGALGRLVPNSDADHLRALAVIASEVGDREVEVDGTTYTVQTITACNGTATFIVSERCRCGVTEDEHWCEVDDDTALVVLRSLSITGDGSV